LSSIETKNGEETSIFNGSVFIQTIFLLRNIFWVIPVYVESSGTLEYNDRFWLEVKKSTNSLYW